MSPSATFPVIRTLLPFATALICAAVPGQTGRTMILRAPAIPGQTAQFELTHPAGAAGNAYAFLASLPPYAPTTAVTVPGLTVQGLARVNPQSFLTAFSGVLGASGSVVHSLPVPNTPSYLGLAFDLQSIDWSLANGTLAFADNDITVAVRLRQWQTPTILTTTSQTGQPRICVHPQGTAVAAWVRATTNHTVEASTWQPGAGWSAPVPVSTNGAATELAMGMDQAGNVIAVWKEFDTRSIWSSRRDVAAGWSTPVLLETGGGDAGNPQVAVDAAGNAIAVWWQYDGIFNTGVMSMFANRFATGIGWGSAVAIENDAQSYGEPPQIACDAAGNATVVWRWTTGSGPSFTATVWSNRYTPGSGWGTAGPVTTDTDVSPNVPPEVTVDANGNAIATWEAMGSPYREIHASRRTGSGAGTWGPTIRLDPATTITSDTPKLAMLGSGNAIAVWAEHDGTRYNVMHATFDVGTGWSPAAIAATSAGASCSNPQVAVDGQGGVVITWFRGNPGVYNTCWSSRLPAGGTWSAPVQIDNNSHNGVVGAHLGADAGGNAIAVIEVYRSGVARTVLGNEYR